MAQTVLYRFARASLIVCGYLAQQFFIGLAGFTWFLMGNRPEYVDLEHDLIRPLTNKGRTVFISNGEQSALSFLKWGTVALVGIILVAWFLDRRNRRLKREDALIFDLDGKPGKLERSLKVLLLIELYGIFLLLVF